MAARTEPPHRELRHSSSEPTFYLRQVWTGERVFFHHGTMGWLGWRLILHRLYIYIYFIIIISIYIYIWANYNNSPTWNKAILGWFPSLTMIPVRSQWGRYNLPRYIVCIWTFDSIVCIWTFDSILPSIFFTKPSNLSQNCIKVCCAMVIN